MHGVQRPLSPYWIYRWEITMWLSSLHRITGLLLSLGAVALAVWLIALASGAESFSAVSRVYGAGWFKLLLVGWTFCFFYHLANGVRHLAWRLRLRSGADPIDRPHRHRRRGGRDSGVRVRRDLLRTRR